ncbi:hypothetical protein A3F66_02925 [candidate division TM6 bacterium RIFCSPHIGHO2_12_FULL_32_22]|nr:MAG: hypothetical protein A3F66_02925 [candidate division TM6 bacterium RIFCSPHIGHO2_12_FULL_32_22]
MKKLFLFALIPSAIFCGIPQTYDSKDDSAKLDDIIKNIGTIKDAFTKCIAKLQVCMDTNKKNMTEIGKTSSKIDDTNKAFDDAIKLAGQASDLVDQMTQKNIDEKTK